MLIKRTCTSEITSSRKYYTNINFNDENITNQIPSKNVPIECLLCKAASREPQTFVYDLEIECHETTQATRGTHGDQAWRSRIFASNPYIDDENGNVYIEKSRSQAGVKLCRTLEARERLLLPKSDDELAKIEEQPEKAEKNTREIGHIEKRTAPVCI